MESRYIRLFSVDLDGTLLGDAEATGRFNETWNRLSRGTRPLLVYNTGRTVADTSRLVAAGQLAAPDYIIGSLGTEVCDLLYNRVKSLQPQNSGCWDLAKVERIMGPLPGVERQPAEFQNPNKSSWFWPRALTEDLRALGVRLKTSGVDARLVYSSRYYLDVIPAWAGKGLPLERLCQGLRVPLESVLVAGDTGNDHEMFLLPGIRGIVVQNALPELHAEVLRLAVYVSEASMADGVLEGLRYFEVIPSEPRPRRSLISSLDSRKLQPQHPDSKT